jgi:hypothetical protein
MITNTLFDYQSDGLDAEDGWLLNGCEPVPFKKKETTLELKTINQKWSQVREKSRRSDGSFPLG